MAMIPATSREDDDAIRTAATDYFSSRAPLELQQEQVRRQTSEGSRADPRADLVKEMAKLDFFLQAVPVDVGGMGMSPTASGLICEAAGRELVPGVWLDQLIAVHVLSAAGGAGAVPFASGEQIAAVAFGGARNQGFEVDPTSGSLTGTARVLRFGDAVDRWVLVTPSATAVVDPAAGASEVVAEPEVDPLVRSVAVILDDVRAELVIPHDRDHFDRCLGLASGLTAAFSVGGAGRALDEAVAYVKEREQFGKPVGSFQAVKHRAANTYIELVHARALVHSALATGNVDKVVAARIAADRCYRHAAEAALQMHGGIGFTTEVPIHLFLKNAQHLRGWPRPIDDELDAVRSHLQLDVPLVEALR